MQLFACALASFFLLVAKSQPAFPPGIGDVMSAMNDDTKKVNTQNAGEEDALIALRKHASDSLESDLLASAMASGLDQAAYAAARIRLLKFIFVGGCPRDVSAQCPAGWDMNKQKTSCTPPEDYDGRCGETAAADLDGVEKKEAFAWRCRASWPCQASCKRDFDKCPQAWQGVGRVCAAPADYDGICSAAMDFESYSLGDKRHWTLMCGVDWPCKGSEEQLAGNRNDVNGPLAADTPGRSNA